MRVCNTEFNEERTRMYLYAMNRSPNARNSELAALELTEFSPNRVIELGAGEGFLTKYLSSIIMRGAIARFDNTGVASMSRIILSVMLAISLDSIPIPVMEPWLWIFS